MRTSQQKQTWMFSRELSEPDYPFYIHVFPIIKDKYTGKMVLHGEIIWNKTEGTYTVNVVNDNDGTPYSQYYNNEYGNYKPILAQIENNISKEFWRLGIKCQ